MNIGYECRLWNVGTLRAASRKHPRNTFRPECVQVNAFTQHAASLHLYTRILLFESVVILLLFFLRILNSHLAVLQSIEGFGQDDTRTKDNLCLLDEGIVVVFFGEGTLSAEGNLERAKFTQTDDFAILNRFLYYIFQGTKTAYTSVLWTVQVAWIRSAISRMLTSPRACAWA